MLHSKEERDEERRKAEEANRRKRKGRRGDAPGMMLIVFVKPCFAR